MKRKLMTHSVVAGLLVTVVAVSAQMAQAHSSAAVNAPVEVKILVPDKMPVSVDYAAVTSVDGKRLLTYRVTNLRREQTHSFELSVVVYKADGHPRGGQGWVRGEDIVEAGQSNDFTVELTNQTEAGDRVVLVLSKVKSTTGRWEADMPKLIDAAKAHVAGRSYKLPVAEYKQGK